MATRRDIAFDAEGVTLRGRLYLPEVPQPEVTLRSLEMAREYEPGTWVYRIGPTPLLMIVADQDTLTPTDLALAAYERALHPKKLLLLKGSHFVPYVEQFEKSSGAAVAWFQEHLMGGH